MRGEVESGEHFDMLKICGLSILVYFKRGEVRGVVWSGDVQNVVPAESVQAVIASSTCQLLVALRSHSSSAR